MRWLLIIFALAICGLSSGCSEPNSPQTVSNESKHNRDRPQIVVTSQILFEMTQTIVGDHASTLLVVPHGVSSPTWSPTSKDAKSMQQADLVLLSGAGYEPWKDRVSLPPSRVRDTAAGYYDQLIRIPDAVTHQHGPGGSHSHPGTVWATWLAPELAAAQVHQVGLHCVRLLPDQKQAIETAEAKLAAELSALHAMIVSIKAAAKNDTFFVFSDAPHYQYLTQTLGWELRYLHWATSGPLTDADRTQLQDLFKSDSSVVSAAGYDRRLFLLDSRHSVETEGYVRESGFTVVRIDLCEAAIGESVSLAVRLKRNLQRILDVLGESTDTHIEQPESTEIR